MFEDMRDLLSFLWSWHWPAATGQVTAVDVERIKHPGGNDTIRLAIAYKFSIGNDGPYTGEGFWRPSFSALRRITSAKHQLHVGRPLSVRYCPDDPSVNKLDSDIWRGF